MQLETQKEGWFIRKGREEGAQKESTYVREKSAVNGGRVGDEGEASGGP
jgi:hypothetical protein